MKRFLIFICLFPGIAVAVFDWGPTALCLAFGFVGGIPAALCSCLSGKIKQAGADGMMRWGLGEAR
jgi:hypothetical protein